MDKKQTKIILISTLFLILTLPIISRTLIYLIEDLNFKFTLLNSSDVIRFISLDTYKYFFTVNVFNAFSWAVIVWNIINQILGNAEIKRQNKFEQKDEYGSHGTARFQTKKEIINNYGKDKLGWFIGSDKENQTYKLGMEALYHPLNGKLNMQITVIGSPGSNKTTGYVLPNIFHLVNEYKNQYESKKEMPDIIITDPKSELFCLTSKFLEDNGYNVVVYDFIFLKYGDKFNSLDFINSEKELMEIADGYIKSIEASTGGKSSDGFWNEQEGQALAALLGAVKQNYENPKFEDVLDLLTNKFVNKQDGSLDVVKARQYFVDNVKGSSLQLWSNFLMICKSETTAGNVLGGLAGKLKLFAINDVKKLMSTSTFNIRQLGSKIGDNGKEKPVALFIFMPDSDRTFAPLINVVISTLFKQLYKTAYDYHNKLASPVYFIIEEMANIGKISGIQEMLGTMRGRRIYPMMIWQSLSQMKDRYDKGWEDILSMCDTQVYLGVNDEFTAKYCSNALGNTTIKTQGVSSKSSGYGIKDETESNNFTSRKLMFPEEVKALDNSKLILSQRAFNPILVNKVQYTYWEKKFSISEERSLNDLPLLDNEMNKKVKDFEINDDNYVGTMHKLEREEKQTNDEKDIEKEIIEKEVIEESKEKNYFTLNKQKNIER